jgi:uncharacterized membrane protein YphA (DoxX/SURF4 family)
MSGYGKLAKDPRQLKTMATVGFPEDRLWLLASAEIAGTAGLVAGLFWWPACSGGRSALPRPSG